MKTLTIIILVHVTLAAIVWMNIRPRQETQVSPLAATTQSEVTVEAIPKPIASEPPVPEPPPAPPRKDPMAKWTAYANGYTWVYATEEEKRALVRGLASASPYGYSEDYFYDALQEFYSETSLRLEKLNTICGLIEAGGRDLPARMRKY
jgi:hypothetical protein